MAGPHADHGPPGPRGHRVPGRGPRLPGPDRGLLLARCSPAPRRPSTACAPTSRRGWACARESVFETLERAGKRGRLVGIAHLLDPFGEDVVRSVTSVQPTERDRPLADRRRAQGGRGRGPRPAGAPAAGGRPARPRARHAQPRVPGADRGDRPPRRRLPGLPGRARQARRRHRDPDGRPRPGPRHRRPRPPGLGRAAGAVRGLGPGRGARRREHASRARCCELAPHGQRACWASTRPRPRAGARWSRSATRGVHARRGARRALPGHRRRPRRGAAHGRGARRAAAPRPCGMDVDVLVVDDGSQDAHARHGPRGRGRGALPRRVARPRRRAAHRPRARARRRLRRRGLPRRRRRVRRRRAGRACSSRWPAAAPTTCWARASWARARA